MRDAIPDRERWLALGLLLALLGVAYLLLVHPWWTVPMLALDNRIDTLQERDLRARMELKQAPDIRKRLAAVQAQAARVPGFMAERSPALATAALVQRLETAVAEASPGNRSCAISNRSPMTEPRQNDSRAWSCRCACVAAVRNWRRCCIRWKADRRVCSSTISTYWRNAISSEAARVARRAAVWM